MYSTVMEWKDRSSVIAWLDRAGMVWANRTAPLAIEVKVYNALVASTALTNFTSASIYPDVALQGGAVPMVVFQRISGLRMNALDGFSGLENPRFQFNCYSTAVDDLRGMSDAVISALTSSTTFRTIPMDSPQDDYDDMAGLYRRIIDISLWNQGSTLI